MRPPEFVFEEPPPPSNRTKQKSKDSVITPDFAFCEIPSTIPSKQPISKQPTAIDTTPNDNNNNNNAANVGPQSTVASTIEYNNNNKKAFGESNPSAFEDYQ